STSARHWANAFQISRSVDRNHSRGTACRVGADAGDLRECMRRAHENAVQQARQAQIVGVMANALNKPRIFLALEALTDPLCLAICAVAARRLGGNLFLRRLPWSLAQRALWGHLAGSRFAVLRVLRHSLAPSR